MPALFYHLTRSTEEDLIRMLITRAMANGWRVMLRGTDEAALRQLDARLWAEPKDSFLPHGMEGGPQDADQPVLLGKGAAVNQPQGVILTGGAIAVADEAKGLERLWVLFDGADQAAVNGARGLWRQLTDAGVDAEYWSEDSGKWAKTAEKKAG
ncbi:MAG: DNA polymerase III subunit chi [Paracoccaceae bacterium]